MFELKIIVDELTIIQRIICKKYEDKKINLLKNIILDKYPKMNTILCDDKFILISDFFDLLKNIEKIIKKIKNSKLIDECNEHTMLRKFIKKQNKNFVILQNKLWNKYRYTYIFLQKCYHQKLNITETTDEIMKMIRYTKNNKIFKKIITDVNKYRNNIFVEWKNKKKLIINILEDIMKIKLSGKHMMLSGSDKIYCGMNLSKYKNNTFIYGHKEEWNNYNMVYIAHEILHSMFGSTDVEHCIIELITDNELRIRLNGCGKYFEMDNVPVGHLFLRNLELKIYPHWQEYLKNKKNIYEFRDEMIKIFDMKKY